MKGAPNSGRASLPAKMVFKMLKGTATPRSGTALVNACMTVAMVDSMLVAPRPEMPTGGSACTIDPGFVLISMQRRTPAFIGMGGRMAAMAKMTAEVVAAMLQLMPDCAAPSLSVRSKMAQSPEIVSFNRMVTGSPVYMSMSTRSSLV